MRLHPASYVDRRNSPVLVWKRDEVVADVARHSVTTDCRRSEEGRCWTGVAERDRRGSRKYVVVWK